MPPMALEFHPDEQRVFLDWMNEHFEKPFKYARFNHTIDLNTAAERIEMGGRSIVMVTCPSCGSVELIDPNLPRR
jgi:hypothetical protein